jgi:MinD superfamily P-loop ATPase
MILVAGGTKGGSGKTTIATTVAIMRAAEGRDVLLIDADDQETASDFTMSVIFLSRVMRHVSIATWVYILACDGKGARAPGGHGTSNSPGDHYHGSS